MRAGAGINARPWRSPASLCRCPGRLSISARAPGGDRPYMDRRYYYDWIPNASAYWGAAATATPALPNSAPQRRRGQSWNSADALWLRKSITPPSGRLGARPYNRMVYVYVSYERPFPGRPEHLGAEDWAAQIEGYAPVGRRRFTADIFGETRQFGDQD